MSTNETCTQIMNMTLRDILTEWGQTIQGFIQDITNPTPYTMPTETQPTSRVSLLISTFTRGRRMFYLGLTCVLISVLLLFWDQPVSIHGGGFIPPHLSHMFKF